MAKYGIRRVLIKKGDQLYRLFSFAFELDKYGEPYLKIIFPQLGSRHIQEYMGPDSGVRDPANLTDAPSDMQELSYHYISGVMHFKGSSSGYHAQTREAPTLSPEQLVKVIRIGVSGVSGLDEYSKNLTAHDFVLPDPLGVKSRKFYIYLAHTGPAIRLDITDTAQVLGSVQITTSVDPNVRLLITDHEEAQESNPDIAFGIFFPEDKTVARGEPKAPTDQQNS